MRVPEPGIGQRWYLQEGTCIKTPGDGVTESRRRRGLHERHCSTNDRCLRQETVDSPTLDKTTPFTHFVLTPKIWRDVNPRGGVYFSL